jgi:hypothetical protein
MEHNVLSSRAWVFQEYFLAPRTLHFTAHQLVWDCRSSRTCETFPGGFNSGYPTLTALKTSIMLNGPNINDDIADKWGQVVAGYSGGSVIFRKDKVVALSGVARLFAERFGTTYLAGMWKEDLVKQLTWHTSTPSAIEIRGPIPSWSWASIDTRVNYLERDEIKPNFRPLVSILEATTVVSNDDFGDVKGGTIRMRCHLPIVATLMEQTAPAPPAIFRVDSGSAHMAHVMLWHDTTRYSVGDELCFVALLDATRWKGCLTGNEDIICGLVIEPVQPTSYRRTGYFEIVDYYGDFEEFEAAEDEATSESKYFIGESLGSDEDGREMCIITLI